jgi:ribosomal protein S12 methylthiotransferase accessory factor
MHQVSQPQCSESIRLQFPGLAVGKGWTEPEAKASCLAEAVERYSATFRGDSVRIRASFHALGDEAIHPLTLLNFSAAQYANRDEWNARHSPDHQVPEPFDECCEIEWTPVWSLTDSTRRYLPTPYCYLSYSDPENKPFCVADSNGCAAGNVIEEAILQGFLELVERDAAAIWWYNRVCRPGVEFDDFTSVPLRRVRPFFHQQGRDLHVLDITADFGIPVFVAVSADAAGGSIMFGLGAHLDARLALSRAIAELYQVVAGYYIRQDVSGEKLLFPDCDLEAWMESAKRDDQPYIIPEKATRELPSRNASLVNEDLLEEVRLCVSIAAKHNMETLLLDLTQPDLEFCAVRVVVPGLRHYRAQFGPGRLYDVPVALGWLKTPRREADLNPFPYPF